MPLLRGKYRSAGKTLLLLRNSFSVRETAEYRKCFHAARVLLKCGDSARGLKALRSFGIAKLWQCEASAMRSFSNAKLCCAPEGTVILTKGVCRKKLRIFLTICFKSVIIISPQYHYILVIDKLSDRDRPRFLFLANRNVPDRQEGIHL